MTIDPNMAQAIAQAKAAAPMNAQPAFFSVSIAPGTAGGIQALNQWGIPVGLEREAAYAAARKILSTMSAEQLPHWRDVIETMVRGGADPGKIFAMLVKFNEVSKGIGPGNWHPQLAELHPDDTPSVGRKGGKGYEPDVTVT